METILTGPEIMAILPEIILVAVMNIALIVPVLPPFRAVCRQSHAPMFWMAILGLVAAIVAALGMMSNLFGVLLPDGYVAAGLLAVDPYALTFKLVLYVFAIFVLFIFNSITREGVRTTDSPDYVCLILGAVLGMSLMASASNFLMIFLAIEAASFPSYALAGFYKSSRRSSEGSMKYVLFGSATTAVMLYGLSMLYGTYGTLNLAEIATAIGDPQTGGMTAGLAIGLFGFIVGVGFKLSAVPMHFWCPDVFEGAPFEITTFLSVASKGAAIILLLRVMLTLGAHSGPEQLATLQGISWFVGLVGLATATWGNLAAYYQTNIKRLLAFSSIAHAGYMIMAASLVTTTMRAADSGPSDGNHLAYAILFYLTVYCFMNFGAFTIAAIIAKDTGSEELDDYAGLFTRNPALAVLFICCLMSLFGMPTTGGFWAKVYIGFAMWSEGAWWFVVALVINTVLSLYVYLKPIIVMVFKDAAGRPALSMSPAAAILVVVSVVGVFATGLLPDQMTSWARTNAVLIYHAHREVSEVAAAESSEPDRLPVDNRRDTDADDRLTVDHVDQDRTPSTWRTDAPGVGETANRSEGQ